MRQQTPLRHMQKILVLYYSQSGQSLNILQSLTKPMIDAGHHIHFEEIKPVEKYPFPWSAYQFFNAFPETFQQQPLPLHPISPKAFDAYDLVIMGYQPWFLTPSRPISSFLQSNDGKTILQGKQVITILGCRNMWLGAQEKVKRRLIDAGASLKGHIALIDRSGNITSLVTILRWMLTGKKDGFLFFPPAGVSADDVRNVSSFGESITQALKNNTLDSLQPVMLQKGAVEIRPGLVLMEKRGQKAFSLWSRFISSGGTLYSTGRKIRVYTFLYLLVPSILILSPLLWTLSKIMLMIKRKELVEDVAYYKQTSLR